MVVQAEGSTPLHVSAAEGDEPTMKVLLQFKVNPNIVDKVGLHHN